MKYAVIRKLDPSSRLVIDSDLRRALGVDPGEELEIYKVGSSICIRARKKHYSSDLYAILQSMQEAHKPSNQKLDACVRAEEWLQRAADILKEAGW